MNKIISFCPICNKDQEFSYEISLIDIYESSYKYGEPQGCNIQIEWTCEDGFIIETEEINLKDW